MGLGLNLSKLAAEGAVFIKEQVAIGADKAAQVMARQETSTGAAKADADQEAGLIRQALGKLEKPLKNAAERVKKTLKAAKVTAKEILPVGKLKELAQQFSGRKRGEHKPDTLVNLRKLLQENKTPAAIIALVKKSYPANDNLLVSEGLEFLESITALESEGDKEMQDLHAAVTQAKKEFDTENKKEIDRKTKLMETLEITSQVPVGELKNVRQLLDFILNAPTPQEINEAILKNFSGQMGKGAINAFLHKAGEILRTPELTAKEFQAAKATRSLQAYIGVHREASRGVVRIIKQFDRL